MVQINLMFLTAKSTVLGFRFPPNQSKDFVWVLLVPGLCASAEALRFLLNLASKSVSFLLSEIFLFVTAIGVFFLSLFFLSRP